MDDDFHNFSGRINGTFNPIPLDVSGIEHYIEQYWQDLQAQGHNFTNDPLLMVREKKIRCESSISFEAQLANYSYFLFQQDHPDQVPHKYRSKSIAPVLFAKTTDNYYVLGLMGKHTRHAGKILAPGGALGTEDVFDKNISIEHCLLREFQEETGLQKHHLMHYAPFGYYLAEEYPSLILFYQGNLVLDSKQVFHFFHQHQKKQQVPEQELQELRLVERYGVEQFLSQEHAMFYLPLALRRLRANGL